VSQVVKGEIPDAEKLTGARECGADALGVAGKDAFASLRLPLDDFPSFCGVLKRLLSLHRSSQISASRRADATADHHD